MFLPADFERPSNMQTIEGCPGKPTMEARACNLVPGLSELTNEAAEQGILGHLVIANVVLEAFAGDWSRCQEVIKSLDSRITHLKDWAQHAVRNCVRYAFAEISAIYGSSDNIEILVEHKLEGIGIDINRGGTADIIIKVYRNGSIYQIIVIDHKTGFKSQGEAADHLQLACYAVMSHDKWKPKSGVVVHLSMGRRNEFSASFYDTQAINAVRQRIKKAVAKSRGKDPQLNPSADNCYFCKALTFCRAARERIMHANEKHALLGADPKDRMQLAEDAKLAKRFAQAAGEVAKLWQEQESENMQEFKSP